MEKVYLVPVKRACNANCSFCISKDYRESSIKEVMDINDPEVLSNLKQSFSIIKNNFRINKFEVTGGGEPFLNKNLQCIINTIKDNFNDVYIKLYTNGFIHKKIENIEELNISRGHDNSEINNSVYLSEKQNDLEETLIFFRPTVEELRLCTVMMKGLMDNADDYSRMVNRLDYLVDTFVLRPLIPEKNDMEKYIVDFKFEHPKLKKDVIDCFCHKNLVIGPDGKLYQDFNFKETFKV